MTRSHDVVNTDDGTPSSSRAVKLPATADHPLNTDAAKLWAVNRIMTMPKLAPKQRLLAIELVMNGHGAAAEQNLEAALAFVERRRGNSPRDIIRIGMMAQGDEGRFEMLCEDLRLDEVRGLHTVIAITPDYAVIEWIDPDTHDVVGGSYCQPPTRDLKLKSLEATDETEVPS